MANFMELDESGRREWENWLADQPENVREMAIKLPPWKLYRLNKTGHRVYIISYDVDPETRKITLQVAVSGRFNAVIFERRVFGIDPEHLEECDLPGPNDPVGTLENMIDAGIAAADKKVN